MEDDVAGEEVDGPLPWAEVRSSGLLAEAERELQVVRESTYTHQLHIDEGRGRFDYDCSGFVGYALSRVDPQALRAVRDVPGSRPLAKHFEAFFSHLSPLGAGRWQPVRRVDALAPGDVIAWKRPAESTSKNTGHVVLVAGPPLARSAHELVVPIIDSTAAPHGRGDSREPRHATGLGQGAIVLQVDDAGRPTGFRWTVRSHRLWETEISMGHLRAAP